jgi:hypothetical protein
MPVGGRKKQHRGRKLAAGRRGEPEELTREDCGSRRKLAAGCRKVPRRVAVARHLKNIFRTIRTWGNWGSRSKLTFAGRSMTSCAEVAWLRKNVVKKDWTRNQEEGGAPKGRQEAVKGPGMQNWNKETGHKTAATTQRGFNKTLKKTVWLEIGKRAAEISSRLRTIKDWALWRGRPLRSG